MIDLNNIGVVGGGLMGSGIAEVSARAGLDVTVVEPTDELLGRARERVTRSLASAESRGKITADERATAAGRIRYATAFEQLRACDLVVEAVPEKLELKRQVFEKLDEVCSPDAVLASNTSSIPIAELGGATTRPERVVGLHFFSPVPVMRLLELVKAIRTSDETVEVGKSLGQKLDKEVILTKDRAGFIVNMLLIPYLLEAIRMFESGFAAREDIDLGMMLGTNHPMGPLTLLDYVGLDTTYYIANILYEELHEPKYAPPPLLKQMVTAGLLGRKSGRGFYDYAGGEQPPQK